MVIKDLFISPRCIYLMTPLLHRRFSSWNCSAISCPSRVAMTPLLVATLRLAVLLFGLFRGAPGCSPAILLPPNYHFPSPLVLPLHFLILLHFPNPPSFCLFILSSSLCSPRLIPCPILSVVFSLPYSFFHPLPAPTLQPSSLYNTPTASHNEFP